MCTLICFVQRLISSKEACLCSAEAFLLLLRRQLAFFVLKVKPTLFSWSRAAAD